MNSSSREVAASFLAIMVTVTVGIATGMASGCSSEADAQSPEGGSTIGTDAASAGTGPGCAALTLVTSRCASCHSDPPNGAPMALNSLEALRAPSLANPKESNVVRSLARMRDLASPMPPAPSAPATSEEVAILSQWLEAGTPECTSDMPTPGMNDPSPNQIPQDELFACDPKVDGSSAKRLRRLDRNEFRLNMPTNGFNERGWASANPFDSDPLHPYATYAVDETLDDDVLDLYLDPGLAGLSLGQRVATYLEDRANTADPQLRCIFTSATVAPACLDYFIAQALERGILFRPPQANEATQLKTFALTVLAAESGLSQRKQSIATTMAAGWMTTGALFRSEMGEVRTGDSRFAATNWELAQALSYMVGGRAPRAPRQAYRGGFTATFDGHFASIALAAADGSIQNPTVMDSLFRQNAGGTDLQRLDIAATVVEPGYRAGRGEYWLGTGIAAFFREWLGYGSFANVFKDNPGKTSRYQPRVDTNGFDPTTRSYLQLQTQFYLAGVGTKEADMVQQTDDAIARVVHADQDVLQTLLTTRQFYVDATTTYGGVNTSATHHPYNLSTDVPATRSGRWVTLPAAERAGFLTHPAWLATHGGNFEDDPSAVHRGKWIRENLLCEYVPPLSLVKVPAMVGPSAPNKTARIRLEEATASAQCQGCHKLMNPLGFPFEIYNHAGFLRAVDHDGSQPSGMSVLSDMTDPALNGPVRDAVELSEKLAKSNHVKRCFVRQAFRYFAGRDETRADACTLQQMEKAYDKKGSFYAMVSSLLVSDALRFRHAPKVGE